ncbi:MAG: hypothetical protein GX638_00350 [Crenarchaeota archaeon]|nr:hypothetical protein [Thermoproteota archaeon]
MNNKQKKLIEELMLSLISKNQFISLFHDNNKIDESFFLSNLKEIYESKNGEDFEYLLFLGFSFNLFDESQVVIFNKALLEDWHQKHEDVAMILKKLHCPQSIEYLYEAIFKNYQYLEYDESHAFEVKCIWAIGSIKTNTAKEKLEKISQLEIPEIREAAKQQLLKL